MAGFDWDPRKELINIRERGIDFTTASWIWGGSVYERVDARRDYGETRIVAYGEAEGYVLAVVYTWRDQARRIISARRADRRERRIYQEAVVRSRASKSD
jgi:uncharacterized DUF497 family protein